MGDIVHPGDMHGRVLEANEIELGWDGNLLFALVGPNLVEGVSGFGDSVHDALRELADNLVKEAVWVSVTGGQNFDPAQVLPIENTSIEANVIELYRVSEEQVCVFVGDDLGYGLFGVAGSVHDAIRSLADRLITSGVWINVSTRREWRLEPTPENLFEGDEPPESMPPN